MKSLGTLKEIKKPSSKSLRVWAKNQWRFQFFEKILKCTHENLNGNWFLPIFYPIFQELCNFIQLWKITPFFYNIFSVSGGSSPPPAGAPAINMVKHVILGYVYNEILYYLGHIHLSSSQVLNTKILFTKICRNGNSGLIHRCNMRPQRKECPETLLNVHRLATNSQWCTKILERFIFLGLLFNPFCLTIILCKCRDIKNFLNS